MRAIEIVSYAVCSGKATQILNLHCASSDVSRATIYIFLLLCPEFHVRKYIFSSWLLSCAFYRMHSARNEVNDRIYLSSQNASLRNGCQWLHTKKTHTMPLLPCLSSTCANFAQNRSQFQTEYCKKIEYILSGCQQRRTINWNVKRAEKNRQDDWTIEWNSFHKKIHP